MSMSNFGQHQYITADDFGFSESVNRAILQLAERGCLNAASLLVNMPFAEDAIRLAGPELQIGLHFCLTSGKSVAPPESVPLLVDENGMFKLGFVGLWRLLLGKKRKDAIEQIEIEFAAQLNKFNFAYTHIDSHQHVHVIKPIFEIVSKESKKRGIRLRIPRERIGGFKRFWNRFRFWLPMGVVKNLILKWHLRGVPQEMSYFGIFETGKIDADALKWILTQETSYEINVHPSLGQTESLDYCSKDDLAFHKNLWRKKEYEALIY